MAPTNATRDPAVSRSTHKSRVPLPDDVENAPRSLEASPDVIVLPADLEDALAEFGSESDSDSARAAADASMPGLADHGLELFEAERLAPPQTNAVEAISIATPLIERHEPGNEAPRARRPAEAPAIDARLTAVAIAAAVAAIAIIATLARVPAARSGSPSIVPLPSKPPTLLTATTPREGRPKAATSGDEPRPNAASRPDHDSAESGSRAAKGASVTTKPAPAGRAEAKRSASAHLTRPPLPAPAMRPARAPTAVDRTVPSGSGPLPPRRVPDLPDASQPKAPLAAKPLLADLSEAKAPAAAVAAAASTAAPLPPSPTAVPPPPNTATIAVQAAVGRYQSAFSALNAGAALSVWPSVDAKALERAFERLETQALEFDRCVITVTGVLAEAVCAGRARYVPKVGNKSAHVESRQWKFHLRKTAEAWLIHSVNAR